MGATLHFSTEQFFDEDLKKAEVYFKKIIKHIDRYNDVGRSQFWNPAIVGLLKSMRSGNQIRD
jgi:hypothetical protein